MGTMRIIKAGEAREASRRGWKAEAVGALNWGTRELGTWGAKEIEELEKYTKRREEYEMRRKGIRRYGICHRQQGI